MHEQVKNIPKLLTIDYVQIWKTKKTNIDLIYYIDLIYNNYLYIDLKKNTFSNNKHRHSLVLLNHFNTSKRISITYNKLQYPRKVHEKNVHFLLKWC